MNEEYENSEKMLELFRSLMEEERNRISGIDGTDIDDPDRKLDRLIELIQNNG